MASNGIIYLDNPTKAYFSGQNVTGRVEYVFSSQTKVRSIYVMLRGEAHVQWTRRSSGRRRSYNRHCTGDDVFCKATTYLIGGATGGGTELPVGKHTFNFICAIPVDSPSSFESSYGRVRYTIKATVDRPWKFNLETKTDITVQCLQDLSLDPANAAPIHIQMEKTFCCFCCASGPVHVDVRVPVSGFCPGENILITVDVDNKSNTPLNAIEISLMQCVKYEATSDDKKIDETLQKVQEGPVPPQTTVHFDLNLAIPGNLMPSKGLNCKVIKLRYYLKVRVVVVDSFKTGMEREKTVTIGSLPLKGGPRPPPVPAMPSFPFTPSIPFTLASPAAPASPATPVMDSSPSTPARSPSPPSPVTPPPPGQNK